MRYSKRNTRCNGIGSIINGITNFLSKGWNNTQGPQILDKAE